jgi:hypothetical protein
VLLDSVIQETVKLVNFDTVFVPETMVKKPHSPHKATIMAMVLPSSGQIYNEQYWKLPILYGGIAAVVYGITWNSKYYKRYNRAFIDYSLYLLDKAESPDLPYPEDPSWDKVYKGGDVEGFSSSMADRFKTLLENKKISYKRNRDLLYLTMLGVYAIQIIDACVFAHFYDFEIDDNLSMDLRPTVSPFQGGMVGLTLTFNLK